MNAGELSKCLIDYFPRAPIERQLLFCLLYWLGEGNVFSVDHIGRRLGYSRETLDEIMKTLPGVEVDSSGRIVSAAELSALETPYPMDGEKCRVYAQSALDAVVVPTLLLTKIAIEHRCPDKSARVHLHFGFDQAFAVDPAGSVISFPSIGNIRKYLAAEMAEFRLFSSSDSAGTWLNQHSDGALISAKDVFLAAVQLRRSLMDPNTSMLALRQ